MRILFHFVLVLLTVVPVAGPGTAQVEFARRITAPWPPTLGVEFDVQLNDPRRARKVPKVPVVELDIDIDQDVLNEVKARGTRVICYFSAGSWESYRGDAADFPGVVLGNAYDGFRDERWLDIRNIAALTPVMRARMDRCLAKGFDAVDPDNVDGYENATGFPLTSANQLTYDAWLKDEAHARGLLIVLKNTTSLAVELDAAGYDMALTESCFKHDFCNEFQPFLDAGKAVFDLEYEDERMRTRKFCPQAAAMHISAILKRSSGRVDG